MSDQLLSPIKDLGQGSSGKSGNGSSREARATSERAMNQALHTLERLGPDHFELYFMRKTAVSIEAKDQAVESLSRAEDVGLSVRVIKDQKAGFSFTTSLEPEAITRACKSALEIALAMPEDEHASLHSFGSSVYSHVDSHDSRGLERPLSEKIALALELEKATREANSLITGIRKASVSETEYEIHLMDSSREQLSHRTTLYLASVSCKAEKDGDSQTGGDMVFSSSFEGITGGEIAQVAKRAAKYATELLGAVPGPTLQCPAILRNDVVADLLGFLSSSFSAEEVSKGRSMLADQMGEKIFSEHITLIDDGLMPNGFLTCPFDGEGVPSTRTTLVDGGLMNALLTDLYHAKKMGLPATGSASRGIKAPPSISTSNLYLKKGRKKPDSLMDGITRGVLITDLLGVHTANPVTGEFSLGASGFLIEKGKIARPIKGFAVAGNILEIFRRVTDVANDLRFFGSVGAPSVRISELAVSGR